MDYSSDDIRHSLQNANRYLLCLLLASTLPSGNPSTRLRGIHKMRGRLAMERWCFAADYGIVLKRINFDLLTCCFCYNDNNIC